MESFKDGIFPKYPSLTSLLEIYQKFTGNCPPLCNPNLKRLRWILRCLWGLLLFVDSWYFHYDSRWEVGYQRCQRTRLSLVFSPNRSFTQACVIVLRIMCLNTNSRLATVIQITIEEEEV